MANARTPQVVRSYLSELETALGSVPSDVRHDILAGVREELDGLDATAAAARIEALGDPEFIAAEARAEASAPDDSNQRAERTKVGSAEPRWYPVLASLLVAFGGILIPVIGWVVGMGMVWMSKTWKLRDKWIATLTPFVAVGVSVLLFALTSISSDSNGLGGGPLMPGLSPPLWSSMVLMFPVVAVVGIWLLWRAKHVWSSGEQVLHTPSRPVGFERRERTGWYPVVTVLLLIIGGYVIPVLGWVLGVVMLWASDAWSAREKWLGTLAGPLAVLVSGVLWLGALLWLRTAAGAVDPFLLVALSAIVLPTIANVLVGIRLLRRAR